MYYPTNENEAIKELQKGQKFNSFMFSNFKSNKRVVLCAVLHDGSATKSMDPQFLNDYDVAYNAVSKNGFTLTQFSEELQNNIDIVKQAISKHSKVYKYLSDEMKENFEVVATLLEEDSSMVDEVPQNIKNIIEEFGYHNFIDLAEEEKQKRENFNDEEIEEIAPTSNYSELSTIEQQIAELQKKAELLKSNRVKAVKDIKELIKQYSINPNELF